MFSFFYNGMIHSNVIRHMFKCVSKGSPIGLNSVETRMKFSSPNCYHFKKRSVLAQTIRSLYNSAYFKNILSAIFIVVWKIKVFLMSLYTHPVFEEVYLNIRNQSGCFCETSSFAVFFTAGGTLLYSSIQERF